MRRQIQNDMDGIARTWGRVVFLVCGGLMMVAVALALFAATRGDLPAQAVECPARSCHG